MGKVRETVRESLGGFEEAACRTMLNADSGSEFRIMLLKALQQADLSNEAAIVGAFPGLKEFLASTDAPEKRVRLLVQALPEVFA